MDTTVKLKQPTSAHMLRTGLMSSVITIFLFGRD